MKKTIYRFSLAAMAALAALVLALGVGCDNGGGDSGGPDNSEDSGGGDSGGSDNSEDSGDGQVKVTFVLGNGEPDIVKEAVSGESVTLPELPAREGYTFQGWWTQPNGGGSPFTASTAVTRNITVYVHWTAIIKVPADLSLAESFAWISGNAAEGGGYAVTLNGDAALAPYELSYGGKHLTVILSGWAAERTISLSADGTLFAVGSGATLTLDNHVTLRGRNGNTSSLVRVNEGGTLVMNSGSKISGNTAFSASAAEEMVYSYGGGVYVDQGTFTMNGGEISGNKADASSSNSYTSGGASDPARSGAYSYGGGVYVDQGAFTMNGGTISGNTADSASASYDISHSSYNSHSYGGGVYVEQGTFTMNGGSISGNTAAYSSSSTATHIVDAAQGGGVFVAYAVFNMNGGSISGNTAFIGGGVYIDYDYGGGDMFFTMNGGEIRDNTVGYSSGSHHEGIFKGGGVYVDLNAVFTMSGGTIRGNTVSSSGGVGGGVYHNGESFTMSGGTISGNTSSDGGGVYVDDGAEFTMNDGTISGNTASSDGGGVYVTGFQRPNTFTMNGGTISGNTASSDGGGVYVGSGNTFTMSGGIISGNTASGGGGVYVYDGMFIKRSGGTIYGDTDTTHTARSTENTAINGNGHAVYVSSGKQRNTTAGEGVALDSTRYGEAGGWE
jgi:uncharacterized repeat protein (TIGR02543 family)